MIESLPLWFWPGDNGRGGLLAILIYHRILPRPDPLRPFEPDAELFERQMRTVAGNFSVLPLTEAAQRLKTRSLPKRACCITFDDGYADNLTVASPILERYRLPATVFVATGYLDGGRMFNDSIIDLVGCLPGPVLDLRTLGLGELPIGNLAAKRLAIGTLLSQLRYLPPAERDSMVARVITLAGGVSLPDDLMLSTAQLVELSRRGMDIGGHTMSHTILTTLDEASARSEILGGIQRIADLTGEPVRAFAYPNGRPQRDYSLAHVAMLKEVGIEVGVSTASGIANADTDVLQLPRFSPWGHSMIRWTTRLTRNAMIGRPTAAC